MKTFALFSLLVVLAVAVYGNRNNNNDVRDIHDQRFEVRRNGPFGLNRRVDNNNEELEGYDRSGLRRNDPFGLNRRSGMASDNACTCPVTQCKMHYDCAPYCQGMYEPLCVPDKQGFSYCCCVYLLGE